MKKKWTPPADKPLKRVSRCKRTDCEKDLHCFLKDKSRKTPEGTCLACAASLVDWPRVHERDVRDVEYTIKSLKFEHIRHEFWCTVPLTAHAEAYARRRGRRDLLEAAKVRIRGSIGKPPTDWDRRGTSFEDKGDALHYGQHATATCCRCCVEVWHGIPKDRALAEDEVEYFARLLECYVLDRLPDLAQEPVRLPRKTRAPAAQKAKSASQA